eukprot:4869222-Pyramimonas_sp.AAC.1
MSQRAPEADERVRNHLGCLSVSVGVGEFRILYRTELLHVCMLIQSGIAVLILGVSHRTVCACVLVDFTLTKSVFYACVILVEGVLRAGHIDIINTFGREQVAARLELLVVG